MQKNRFFRSISTSRVHLSTWNKAEAIVSTVSSLKGQKPNKPLTDHQILKHEKVSNLNALHHHQLPFSLLADEVKFLGQISNLIFPEWKTGNSKVSPKYLQNFEYFK